MSEIDPITPHDLIAAARLLRYSESSKISIKKLVQGILKSIIRHSERKTSSIAITTELLLAQGEISYAHKIIQENLSEFIHQNNKQLLSYDCIVLVISAILLAQEICRITGKNIISPDINSIIRDPLEFHKSIMILNLVRNSNIIMNHRIKTKKQECKSLLVELKAAFGRCITAAGVVHDCMDMEGMYIGYLLGLKHTAKASRYLANLRAQVLVVGEEQQSAVAEGVKCSYYALLTRYLVRYRYSLPEQPVVVAVRGMVDSSTSNISDNSSNCNTEAVEVPVGEVNNSYMRIVQALLRSTSSKCELPSLQPCIQDLCVVHTLFHTKALDEQAYIEILCKMIDSTAGSLTQTGLHSVVHSSQDPLSGAASKDMEVLFLLWQELIAVLGPVSSALTEEQTMREDSEVVSYLLSRRSPTIQNSTVSVPSPSTEQSSGEQQSEAEEGALQERSLSSRNWWRTTILSVTQLDGFCNRTDTVTTPYEMEYFLQLIAAEATTAVPVVSSIQFNIQDLYSKWLTVEKEFTAALDTGLLSTQRHQDGDDAGREEDEEETYDSAEEEALGLMSRHTQGGDASQMSNTSHDEAEYHSQESEAEIAPRTATASQDSTVGTTAAGVAVEFSSRLLSLAMQQNYHNDVDHHSTNAPTSIVVSPQLQQRDFAVHRNLLYSPAKGGRGNLRQPPAVHFQLGDRLLELLTYQAVVRAHMDTQDNLFTIRVVQIVIEHCIALQREEQNPSSSATTGLGSNINSNLSYQQRKQLAYSMETGPMKCAKILLQHQISLTRALKIGNIMISQQVNPFLQLPTRFLDDSNELIVADSGSYCPV